MMGSPGVTPRRAWRARWGRLLVWLGMGQFAVSLVLLLVASTSRERLPTWGGVLDVALAVMVVITVGFIRSAAAGAIGNRALRLSYAVATGLPTAVVLALWVVAERLVFTTLLPGLAWRLGMLLYALPAALTLLEPPGRRPTAGGNDREVGDR